MSKLNVADLSREDLLEAGARRAIVGGIAYIPCDAPSAPSVWDRWPGWMPSHIGLPPSVPIYRGFTPPSHETDALAQ